jgi:hypothetical protein
VQRRDGFGYHLVRIDWQRGGPRLGLGIRHFQNRVLVSRTDEGSLSAAVLNIGDHLIDVDGVPVSDKDAEKQRLLDQLGAKGFGTSIVERPDCRTRGPAVDASGTRLQRPAAPSAHARRRAEHRRTREGAHAPPHGGPTSAAVHLPAGRSP